MATPESPASQALEATFDWRDDGLDARALALRLQQALAGRTRKPEENELPLLEERWGPDSDSMHAGTLAMHFMQRFAPVAQRLPRGLAYTAITTMRLERPIGQQEEFNRSVLLYCDWATREMQRLSRRVAALEATQGGLPK